MTILKRSLIAIIALVLVAGVANVANAQGPRDRDRQEDRGGVAFMGLLVQQTAEALGVEPQVVMQALADGQTLNDYIVASGGDPDQIVAAATQAVTDRLNERMATALQDLPDNLNTLMNTVPDLANRNGNLGEFLNRSIVSTVAESLDIDTRTLIQETQSGKSLATVITEMGGDVDAVQAQIVQQATDTINEAVANDRLNQDQADRLIANLEEAVETRLNFVRDGEGRFGQGNDGQGILDN